MIDAELKSIIHDLVNKFTAILHINLFADSVRRVITSRYDKGLDELGAKFDMNFIRDSKKINFLESYTFDNIKGMNDELAERLRKELSQGLLNLESIEQLKERVKKVMSVTAERARMIARTEANRAENVGRLDAARQSGLDLVKQWSAHIDKRTSQVCKDLNGKIVPLNAKFKWRGEEFEAPPAHVNCRSTLLFLQK